MDIAAVAYKEPTTPPPPPPQERGGSRRKTSGQQSQAQAKRAPKQRAKAGKRKFRSMNGTVRRLNKEIDKLKVENAALQEELKHLRVRTGRCVTVREGLDIGLRASMSNQGANSLGMGLKNDLSRWTCVRWEIKTHASLVAYSRQLYKLLGEIDVSSASPSVSIHVVRRNH